MSIFVPKKPYKFSKKRVNALLKEYLPELKMQPGEIMDILVFTLDFEGKFKREMCTTRYVIVHRHSDGAVLIWENYRNNWCGLGFKRFSKDAINSRVKTCWSIKDFEEFLCAISCNLQGHVFGTTNLTQVPMEYACINDKPILDEDGAKFGRSYNPFEGKDICSPPNDGVYLFPADRDYWKTCFERIGENQAPAGSKLGKRSTTFSRTIDALKLEAEKHPDYTLRQLLYAVPTHYSNVVSAEQAIKRYAKQGIIVQFWQDKPKPE